MPRLIPHGRDVFNKDIMAASLDHALWFHRPFRADEWLLYAQDSPNLAGSRGFSRGLIFASDGTLVASVAQEGLLRQRALSRQSDLIRRRHMPNIGVPTWHLLESSVLMKLVTAIIKPFKLEEVRDALLAHRRARHDRHRGEGLGRQKGHTEIYRGAEYAVNFLPKIRIEVAVPEDRADKVVEASALPPRPDRSATARSSSRPSSGGAHPHRRNRRRRACDHAALCTCSFAPKPLEIFRAS